jgi:hypothetical protein
MLVLSHRSAMRTAIIAKPVTAARRCTVACVASAADKLCSAKVPVLRPKVCGTEWESKSIVEAAPNPQGWRRVYRIDLERLINVSTPDLTMCQATVL